MSKPEGSRVPRRMPKRVREEIEHQLSKEETQREAEGVAANLHTACALLTQTSSSANPHLGDVLDRVAVACDELRTLNQLIATDFDSCASAQSSIEAHLSSLPDLWRKIDNIVEFVDEKKRQLAQLESLCTKVEKTLKQ